MKSIEEVNNSSSAVVDEHLMRCECQTGAEQLKALLNLGSTVGVALSALAGKEGAVAILGSIIDHVKSDNYTIQKGVVQ